MIDETSCRKRQNKLTRTYFMGLLFKAHRFVLEGHLDENQWQLLELRQEILGVEC